MNRGPDDTLRALELDAHLVMLEQDQRRILPLLIRARRQLRTALARGTDEEVEDAAVRVAGLQHALDSITMDERRTSRARDLLMGRVPGGVRIPRRAARNPRQAPLPGGVLLADGRIYRA